jgi:hypothetical protein
MQVKITGKKTFYDGQTVYLIGGIKPHEFHKFYKDTESDAFIMNWCDQERGHHALRRAIRHHLPAMIDWLSTNKAVTTCWVDPEIFQSAMTDMFTDYPWGIGFKKDDPLESWFVMRWS